MKKKVISVIIPVYDVEQYVEKCIESVVSQSYKDLEIILIDDGSTDQSGYLCDAAAKNDERIIVIHQENKGLSSARNTGIALATGEVISFVDSDDVLNRYFFETLMEVMISQKADIVQCGFRRFTKEREISEPKKVQGQINIKVLNSEDCNKGLYGEQANEYTVIWNKLYHRKIWNQIRFPVGRIYEDAFTTYKLFYQADRIAVTTLPLYGYRYRVGSIMTQRFGTRNLDLMQAYEERSHYYKVNEEVELYRQCKRKYMHSLVEFYRKALLESNDKRLRFIVYNKAVDVFRELKKYTDVLTFKECLKYQLFIHIPKVYSYAKTAMWYMKRGYNKIRRWKGLEDGL